MVRDGLPTERALADEFGVSRTLVGHALAMLEAEGRITGEGEHAIRAMEVHLLRVEGNLLDAGASRTRT